MEIYSFYTSLSYINLAKNGIEGLSIQNIVGAFAVSFLIWLAFFVLQGFGLFAMAQKKGLKKPSLAFVPFANLLLIDKLAGDCEIFGHKMKRGGMYAMIAQIVVFVTSLALIFAEGVLFTKYASCVNFNRATGEIIWVELDSLGVALYTFYSVWGSFLHSLFGLAYEVLLFVLMISLLKRYTAKNYMILSMLQLFLPISRYVIIFVVRNNKAIDYDEYKRARYEEYRNRGARYGNPYSNPYGRPYGNPYSNPYGNPYGTPYRGHDSNQTDSSQNENPFEEFATPNEDPFEDINDYSSNASNNSEPTQDKSDDEFF